MTDEVQKLADALYYGALMGPTVSLAELRALARDAAAVGARTALEEAKVEFASWTPYQSHDTGETFLADSVKDQIYDYLDKYTTDEETTT